MLGVLPCAGCVALLVGLLCLPPASEAREVALLLAFVAEGVALIVTQCRLLRLLRAGRG